MKIPIFRGCGTALVTPFDSSGNVDDPAFVRLIERQIGAGVQALIVGATTGESAALSDEEWRHLLELTLRIAAGRVPVIAGAGKNDTAHTLRLCAAADALGAQGVLLVTPYYNKTTQAGLIRHYLEIADRCALPILLYNVPSRTGMSFTAETYATLAKHPRIFGVKEASGDFGLILKTKRLCPPDFAIYSGNDDQIVPILSLGGVGVISTASNVVPQKVCAICEAWQNGQNTEAADYQIRLQPLIQALFREVNPIPVKAALQWMGLIQGTLRLPLVHIGPSAEKELRAAMSEWNLL